MKQERLNLFLIDMKYIRNLHNVDDRVSSVSPQIGKQHRIYVGIVVLCNERKYLIPLSHPVEKHKKMKPKADFDKINDKKDSVSERHYKQLCIDELTWCRKNQENIVNKANVLYKLCVEKSGYHGKIRCLDFKRLEKICDKYNQMES